MRCTNCGATVPRDATACPECGVFARVAEAQRRGRRRLSTWILVLLLVVIAGGGAAYYMLSARAPAKPATASSIRVVHDRPGGAHTGAGATISEPEAILRLRRSLGLPVECVAILSHGFHGGAYDLVAVNRCEGTRLGRWRVDGKSGAVSRP